MFIGQITAMRTEPFFQTLIKPVVSKLFEPVTLKASSIVRRKFEQGMTLSSPIRRLRIKLVAHISKKSKTELYYHSTAMFRQSLKAPAHKLKRFESRIISKLLEIIRDD